LLTTYTFNKLPKDVSRDNHSIVPLSILAGYLSWLSELASRQLEGLDSSLAEELGVPAAEGEGLSMENVLLTLSKLMD
jgi:hypothetical protein